MKNTIFRPYKRLYRSAPGARPAVPASARPGRVSLLAMPTDAMGNWRTQITGSIPEALAQLTQLTSPGPICPSSDMRRLR